MNSNLGKILIAFLILGIPKTGQIYSQELKIDREERVVSYLQDGDEFLKKRRKVGDGLYRARFIVTPGFFGSDRISIIDPFADPSTMKSYQLTNQKAQKILEEAGVAFGKGAKVSFDEKTSMLTVVQTPDELELIEAYLSVGYCGYDLQISIRAEIYELPTNLALELLESCEGQSDHTAERIAVRQLVKKGGAKLVALPSVISRSGQRSKISSTYEVPFLENTPQETEKKDEKTANEASIGVRPVGTILEADPVLGADQWTLDISFKLEHHTGPPEFFPVSKKLEIPIFHNKEIITQVTLLKGSYILVGTWKPTGKPEYEEKDLMHVVFLTANVQDTRDYGVLLPAEDPPTKK